MLVMTLGKYLWPRSAGPFSYLRGGNLTGFGRAASLWSCFSVFRRLFRVAFPASNIALQRSDERYGETRKDARGAFFCFSNHGRLPLSCGTCELPVKGTQTRVFPAGTTMVTVIRSRCRQAALALQPNPANPQLIPSQSKTPNQPLIQPSVTTRSNCAVVCHRNRQNARSPEPSSPDSPPPTPVQLPPKRRSISTAAWQGTVRGWPGWFINDCTHCKMPRQRPR
ncbi:hypothetical protein ACVW0A_000656 [Pseudomonas sp. TE3610]